MPRDRRPAADRRPVDARFTRMVGLSAVAHALVFAAALTIAPLARSRPLPMMAYTVELTDASALGGRLPQGAPGRDLSGGPTAPAPPTPQATPGPPPESIPEPAASEPAAKPEPPAGKPEPAKPAEPRPEAVVNLPDLPPKPEPKATPKPVVRKDEPPRPPSEKPRGSSTTVTAAAAKPATGSTTPANASPDAYAASAQRWRSRAGGGLGGGADAASGPIGAGGYGPGGGGQLVGLEFLAYRQKVIDSVKGNWVHVVTAPGLVARVRFEIAADGGVSDVQLEQSAGHAAYDASVLRAVQRVSPLPPPPARYASEFRVFVIEFHSEETTGQGSG